MSYPEYPAGSSVSLCIYGLKNKCTGAYVDNATVQARVLANDGTTQLGSQVTLTATGSNGEYHGVLPKTIDVSPYEHVYVEVTVDGGSDDFYTILLKPHVVRVRSEA